VPLARFTIPELHREVLARGIVAQISGVTLSRWLSADTLQPWRHRSWIFPRDAQFAEKAGRVLDLYARTWGRSALGSDEYVVSADDPQNRSENAIAWLSYESIFSKITHRLARQWRWSCY
jgi:hypothetical protein